MENEVEDKYSLAMDMIRFQQYDIAIVKLEEIIEKENRPSEALSMLGVALSRSGKDIKKAIAYSTEAIKKNEKNASFYYNLSDLYRRLNRKEDAIETLKAGLRAIPGNKKLMDVLNRFGIRKPPLFSNLDRSNPINKIAGKVRTDKKK